jgi:hypothetical protein
LDAAFSLSELNAVMFVSSSYQIVEPADFYQYHISGFHNKKILEADTCNESTLAK